MNEPDRETHQENFQIPTELHRVVRPLIQRHGIKNKWHWYTAALLLALEQGQKSLGEKMGQVVASQHTGGLQRLIDAAVRAGELEDAGEVLTGLDAATQPPKSPPGTAGQNSQPGKPKKPGGGRAGRG